MENVSSSVTIEAQTKLANRQADTAQAVADELQGLQRRLISAVKTIRRKSDMAAAVGEVIVRSLGPEAVWYFQRGQDNRWSPVWRHQCQNDEEQTHFLQDRVVEACNHALDQGDAYWHNLGENDECVVAIPIFVQNQLPDSIGLVLSTKQSVHWAIAILHAIAPFVTLWSVLHDFSRATSEISWKAKLIDLLAGASCHDNLHDESRRLVGELQHQLACSCVALGWLEKSSKACRLLSISGKSTFDRHSEFTRAVEAALDETLWRGDFAVYPPPDDAPCHMTLALQRLRTLVGADVVVSAPLEDCARTHIGAWIFCSDRGFQHRPDTLAFIRESQRFVGNHLQMVRNAQRGPLARLTHAVVASRQTWRGKATMVAACVAAAVLASPAHYTLTCDCQVEPVVRRFVAAPFDGKLEKVLVSPGDVVDRGAILAKMDGRPIRWELAALVAEHSRATKQRDVALAGHDTVTAQLAKLELQRLDLNIQILERRAEHLEIRSTIDGLVISGDQQRAEGAPLTIGQTLFEIAPLDRMTVDVAVPEHEVAFVRDKLRVDIRLDAYPRRAWSGTITKLHPRSENQNGRNVFIAEVHLDNHDGALRPGMNGRAKIVADRHPLAWNLFHRPWEMVVNTLRP